MDAVSIGEHIGAVTKGWNEYSGKCDQHGESTVRLPKFLKNQNWFCSECHSERAKKESEEQWKADRIQSLHKVADIPWKYKGMRFEATTADQKTVRGIAKSFRDLIVSNRAWAVLVLMGSVGTGKTLLASELAQSLVEKEGMSVRYCTAKQMISEIQASYGIEGKSEEGEISKFVQYELLIIDEIDAKPDRENANLLLQEIINRRYNCERPVCVITNQPFDNLARYVGDRVDSRLHENAFVCSFNWDDFRKTSSSDSEKKQQARGFE